MIKKGDALWNEAFDAHKTDFMIRETIFAVGKTKMEFFVGSTTLQELAKLEIDLATKYKIF